MKDKILIARAGKTVKVADNAFMHIPKNASAVSADIFVKMLMEAVSPYIENKKNLPKAQKDLKSVISKLV
ncbi:MAG: hypothetical protein LBT79_01980 [Elusimicrobiota bacterium]|jgi:hypothetical protein|nr:hypothetical protein [Elusimicrobiota bacterium]